MFNWKAEEQSLTKNNHKVFKLGRYGVHEELVYDIEDELNVEEKKSILNEATNGNVEYFIELNMKYVLDLADGIIKKDSWGDAKENSAKAWIRKNDSRHLLWNGVSKDNWLTKLYYRESSFLGYATDWYLGYFVGDEEINVAFHNYLKSLHYKEIKYFKEHDEYEVLKTRFRECGCNGFGAHIGICSNGEIYVYDSDNSRPITIDELKVLLSAYDKLKAYEEELKKDIDIKF